MGAGDLVKWGLILGGGVWGYQKLFGASAASPAPAGGAAPAGGFSLNDLVAALRGTPAAQPAAGGAAPPTAPPAGAGPAPPPPAPVPPPAVGPALAAQLVTATAGDPALIGGKMNADQWTWFYVNKLGRSEIAGDLWHEIFFPNGRPANAADAPMYTAQEFAAALATKGLGGLGAVRAFPVPRVFAPPRPVDLPGRWREVPAARRAVAFAGGQNFVRQGSPMPVPRVANYVRR